MSYENITIEKGMYAVPGKSFTQVLESLDPDENYKGTSLEGLDAFSRQLKRFGIKVSGPDSDCIQKFFSSSNATALFPEYVSRAVKSGIQQENCINDVVASVTKIDGMDYRGLKCTVTDDNVELKDVAEGAYIPKTEIYVDGDLVQLNKRGRMLVASYESIKFQRLDAFTVMLKQIGAHIAKQQLNDAVKRLKNGNAVGDEINSTYVETPGIILYKDVVELYNSLYPYNLNTIIASPLTVSKLLQISEFKDPRSGFNFQGTGKVGTPMGAKIIRCSALGNTEMIGLDKDYALEMVIASDVNIEYDKLIDRQLERAAITSIAGFSKLFNGASYNLSI